MRLRGISAAVAMFVLVPSTVASSAPPMTAPVMDDHVYVFALLELAEYRVDNDANPAAWELVSWVGGDYHRIWFKSEGTVATEEREGDGDVEILYGRLITPWWDFQIGIRGELQLDEMDEDGRVFGAVGVEGLAPGYFDVDATFFVSHEGDVSARFTASYDQYLTQRLIAEPRFELEAAAQEVEELGVGTGINAIELGLRVRYELRREVAPYIGVNWERQLMETADFARERGDEVSALSFVAGVRAWH